MARHLKTIGLATVFAVSAALGGCGDGGVDMEINAPILDVVGVNLMGKPAPEPDLPDRGKLVMPPKTAALPTPGQPTQVAVQGNKQWPADVEDVKKRKIREAEENRQRYCKEGDYSQKANIDEFQKNTGKEVRCRPEWIDNVLGKKPAEDKKS